MRLAAWNSALVLWAAALATIRRGQNPRRAWPWLWPTAFALVAAAWLWPVGWSLGLVYLHPLVALVFLDREIGRRRPDLRPAYRACLRAGLALTAFTYPIVVCVLPPLVWEPWGRTWYLAVAETFAPLAECLLFRLVWGAGPDRRAAVRDCGAIVLANLLSFGLGEFFG